jgi:hypothetical protein
MLAKHALSQLSYSPISSFQLSAVSYQEIPELKAES